MMIQMFAQSFVNGITLGALYGLAAVGLSLVFGVMKVMNVAHGEFVMLGSYMAYWLFLIFHIDPFLGLPIVAMLLFLFGAIFYKLLFSGMVKFHEELKLKNSLLVAFGLFLVFPEVVKLLWTGDERILTPSYSGASFEILGVWFGYVPTIGLLVSLVAITLLQLFLSKTYFGKSVRATAENWRAAKLMGVNDARTYMITFAIGTALAGVAGVLVALSGALTPNMGIGWTIKALIVVVLAGMGSIGGAFIAGLILGVAEAVSAIFMGPYAITVGLVMFLLILMFRPQGLFARA